MGPASPPELQAAIAAMQEGLGAPRRAVLDLDQSPDPDHAAGAAGRLIPA